MPSVLLVEDDIELSTMLCEYLAHEGFRTHTAYDGRSGLDAALSGQHSIVVLDVLLPQLSGIDVLRQLRTRSRVPVLMLSARSSDVDCIVGLELGADDYIAKPCTPRKLLAHINATLRRTHMPASGTAPLHAGPLELRPSLREASYNGVRLDLTATEFSVLEVLARAVGNIVSKSELSQRALGRPLQRFDRSIDVHISNIRQKMPPRSNDQSWIQTVRGAGYLFVQD